MYHSGHKPLSGGTRLTDFRRSVPAGAPATDNKKKRIMSQDRRNDYDVSNTVQVSDPVSVRNAVYELFSSTFPGASYDKIWLAFYDFERLFSGRFPGYKGCDTTYHDVQHTLDMTLALARLVAGYERSVEAKAAWVHSERRWPSSPRCFTTPAISATTSAMPSFRTVLSSRFTTSPEARISYVVIYPSTAWQGTLLSAA